MRNKIVVLFILMIILIFPCSYADFYSNRTLEHISLKPLKNNLIRSGEIEEYTLEVWDDLDNPLNGSFSLELYNNTTNQKINIIPINNFYFFKEGKVNINFQLFKSGINEIIVDVDKGRGKKKIEIIIDSSEEAFSSDKVDDLSYSYIETVLPLKSGKNKIRIYLKDSFGNDIKEGNYTFKILSEIANFDGRIQEEYFLEDKVLINSEYISISGDIIKDKGYIEKVLKIPDEIDKNDGIFLSFYLNNEQKLNPSLNYFSNKEINYENIQTIGLKNEIIFQIDNNRAEVNSFEVFIETPPILINNRTMVPLRLISNFLGVEVEWLSEKNGVKIIGKEKELFLEIGKKEGLEESEIPPLIINGRTYVPLRYIGENFNSIIIWEEQERKIIIKN